MKLKYTQVGHCWQLILSVSNCLRISSCTMRLICIFNLSCFWGHFIFCISHRRLLHQTDRASSSTAVHVVLSVFSLACLAVKYPDIDSMASSQLLFRALFRLGVMMRCSDAEEGTTKSVADDELGVGDTDGIGDGSGDASTSSTMSSMFCICWAKQSWNSNQMYILHYYYVMLFIVLKKYD